MKRRLPFVRAAASIVLAALFVSSSSRAVENAYYFDTFYGNAAVNPGTPIPWVTVTVEDGVAPGSVFVTIANSASLLSSAKLDEMSLNFNPSKNLSSLTFTFVSSTGSFTAPTISKNADGFKAGGDGKYDINFAFASGMAGATFQAGESVTYQVSGIATLIANDFNFLSTPGSGGGSAGPFYAAGHLLGLGTGNKSAWIAPSDVTVIPEPAPAVLLGLGAGLLLLGRSRRRATNPV